MNLTARYQAGVPTTPPPRKPAPNPRYNDLTRPRSLQMDAEHRQGQQAHTPAVDWRGHFWGSAPDAELVQQQHQPGPCIGEANDNICQSINGGGAASGSISEHQRRIPSLSSDPDFPLPWQGKFDLPASDEEIMNSAQTWITQVLHEHGDNSRDSDINVSTDVLLDGRVLCRVANSIEAGSVEALSEDEPDNIRNMYSFLVACRRFGVPAGALFDTVEPDPRRVGLCLHVLSAVVRDTVPQFVGPFLATRPGGCSSPIVTAGDGGKEIEDDGSGHDNPSNANNSNHNHHYHRKDDILVSEEEPARRTVPNTSQRWSSRQTAAAIDIDICPPADEIDKECGQQIQQQQQEYQQRYQDIHQQRNEPRPPTPPAVHPRPLSFPSRSPPAAPADEHAVWNSLFPSSASLARVGGAATPFGGSGDSGERRDGYHDAAAGVTWRTAGQRVAEPPQAQDGMSESFTITALHPVATTAATLSGWLSNLNLGGFEEALVSIGVETMGDLRYLEEQDLYTIGMHGPQIRKLLQNRP